MKRYALPLALSLLALGACTKKEDAKPVTPAKAASAAASSASRPVIVRPAKYDPNLKPTNIVWDSPEKKARFEELQRMRAAQAAQAQAQAGSQPAAPLAPVAPVKK